MLEFGMRAGIGDSAPWEHDVRIARAREVFARSDIRVLRSALSIRSAALTLYESAQRVRKSLALIESALRANG